MCRRAPIQALHTLPDGMRLEVLHGAPESASARPPLLFVHGSFHGAWCWQEHWMGFFSAANYDCYAVSLRGQGGSDRRLPDGRELRVGGDLGTLTDDLAHVVAALPASPVLVAHSFGGLLAEKYCTELGCPQRPPLAGVAIVCGGRWQQRREAWDAGAFTPPCAAALQCLPLATSR